MNAADSPVSMSLGDIKYEVRDGEVWLIRTRQRAAKWIWPVALAVYAGFVLALLWISGDYVRDIVGVHNIYVVRGGFELRYALDTALLIATAAFPLVLFGLLGVHTRAVAEEQSKLHPVLRKEAVIPRQDETGVNSSTASNPRPKRVQVDWVEVDGRELLGIAWTVQGQTSGSRTSRLHLVFRGLAVELVALPARAYPEQKIAEFVTALSDLCGTPIKAPFEFVPNDYAPSFGIAILGPLFFALTSILGVIYYDAFYGPPCLIGSVALQWLVARRPKTQGVATRQRDASVERLAWQFESAEIVAG